MLVRYFMTTNPVCVNSGTSVRRAAEIFLASGIGDIMVIDDNARLVGVLSDTDLLREIMPTPEEVVTPDGSIIDAMVCFEEKGIALANCSIDQFVEKQPLVVSPRDKIFYGATILLGHQIRCIPVVDDNRLIGTLSVKDISSGIFAPSIPGNIGASHGLRYFT